MSRVKSPRVCARGFPISNLGKTVSATLSVTLSVTVSAQCLRSASAVPARCKAVLALMQDHAFMVGIVIEFGGVDLYLGDFATSQEPNR